MSKLGILYPGEMGVSIAASAINNRHQVHWLSQGRSDKTRARAEKYDLIEIGSPIEFCQICELIISICPPHASEDVARSVIESGYSKVCIWMPMQFLLTGRSSLDKCWKPMRFNL